MPETLTYGEIYENASYAKASRIANASFAAEKAIERLLHDLPPEAVMECLRDVLDGKVA